jgi:hypothetical protein
MVENKKKIVFLIHTSLEADIASLVSKEIHKNTEDETIAFHLRQRVFQQRFPELITKMKESNLLFLDKEDFPHLGPVKIFQKIKPDIIITTDDVDPDYHTFLVAAKFLDIPILIIQPGIIGEQPFNWRNIKIFFISFFRIKRIINDYRCLWVPLSEMNLSFFAKIDYTLRDLWSRFFRGTSAWGHQSTTVAVEGDFLKNVLIKQGIPATRIVVTGQPRYDPVYQNMKNEDEQFITHLQSIKKTKKIVLYLPNALYQHLMCSEETYYTMHYQTIDTCKQFSDVCLVIKPHPEETVEYYQQIADIAQSKAIVYAGADLYGLIRLADLVVTGISTTVLQSLLLDKPVVMIDIKEKSFFPSHHEYVPYVKDGVAFGIHQIEDFSPVIQDALYDNEKRKNLFVNRKEFVYNHAYIQDGKASERVADLILHMIEK